MLPAFASTDDMGVRLPGGLAASDEDRAQAALDDAAALLRAEAGKDWTTDGELDEDLPDILVTLTLKVAIRAFDNPTGIESETIAGYSYRNGEVYLTAAERRLLLRAAGGSPALGTITTTRGPLETRSCYGGDFTYVDVIPTGEPLPAGPPPLP